MRNVTFADAATFCSGPFEAISLLSTIVLSAYSPYVAAAPLARIRGRGIAHVVVDVIVPDGGVAREHEAKFVGGNLVVFDRPVIGAPGMRRMDACQWGMLRITRFRMVT